MSIKRMALELLLEAAPSLFLFLSFFRGHLRFPAWCFWLYTSGLEFLFLAALKWARPEAAGQMRILLPWCFTSLFTFFCLTAVKRPLPQILFMLFLSKNYVNTILFFTQSCGIYKQSLTDGQILLVQLLILFVTLPFAWLFIVKMMRPLINSPMRFPFWKYLWLIPVSFYFVYRFGICPQSLGLGGVYGRKHIVLMGAFTVGTFLCYFAIIKMLSETAESVALRERLEASASLLSMQREQYETMLQNLDEESHMRHDFRHHLQALLGYARKGDCEGIEKYLTAVLQAFTGDEETLYSENGAVDAVVRHYAQAAQQKGATLDIRISLPRNLPISETDMCILLGNLLENAAEACGQDDYIQMKAGIVGKDMVAISMKNSFSGPVRCKDGVFYSSKHEGRGLGISSVKGVVQKYNGVSNFRYDGGVFQVSILLTPKKGAAYPGAVYTGR